MVVVEFFGADAPVLSFAFASARLDGHYTVFGHVSAGFDVLDAFVQGSRISRVIMQ